MNWTLKTLSPALIGEFIQQTMAAQSLQSVFFDFRDLLTK